MSTREEHIKYRQIKFECVIMNPILSKEDLEILKEYGTWMEALFLKKIEPLNEKQAEFCRQLLLNKPPEEKFANIFWKYLKRNELANTTELNNVRKTSKDDREDWKKIRKMRF